MELWSAESATELVFDVIDPVVSVVVLSAFMVRASTSSSADPARSRLILRSADPTESLSCPLFALDAPAPVEILTTVHKS